MPRYGRGFSARNAWARDDQVRRGFPGRNNCLGGRGDNLSSTHFNEILSLKRFAETRVSTRRCAGPSAGACGRSAAGSIPALYERTALSTKPDRSSSKKSVLCEAEDRVTPDLLLRDPYLLEVRHDNRVVIADSVSRILGRRYLSRPTYLRSKDDRDHSLAGGQGQGRVTSATAHPAGATVKSKAEPDWMDAADCARVPADL